MKKSLVILLAAALVCVVLGSGAFYVVAENEHACVMRFNKIEQIQSEAGLYFKIPFVDEVMSFPNTVMLYDIPESEMLTADKKNMTVDSYITWKIGDPRTFYQTLGSITEAEVRLDALTYNALKTVMGTLAQADIINMNDGAERNEIYEGIADTVNAQAVTYGIYVEDVKIKQFDLPDSNLNAVYNRMISERNQMAEKYTAEGNKEASLIRNEVDKQVNILISDAKVEAARKIAEGEAEYMRILAEAYNTQEKQDFYEFMLALEALKASLTGDEKTIVLDENSELGKILMGITG